MTRVLLINPPSPEQMGSPLLGLQYVAAVLLARGCEVRVIDAAARYFSSDTASIIAQTRAFSPSLIGFSLFTRWVWHAYGLSAQLAGSCRLLVAGGAHATVRPEETLDRGFHVAVTGEAELTMPALVDYLEGQRTLESIPGICFRTPAAAAAQVRRRLSIMTSMPCPRPGSPRSSSIPAGIIPPAPPSSLAA